LDRRKKLLRVIAYALALNFLAAAGGAGWLCGAAAILIANALKAIKAILFPAPTAPVSSFEATSQPPRQHSPRCSFDELLKKAAGLSADEQVNFLQRSFDSRMAELDLRQRQLDRSTTANRLRAVSGWRRTARRWMQEKQQLPLPSSKAPSQANDQGFQDSLALYTQDGCPRK
jgi:hypothetical protein